MITRSRKKKILAVDDDGLVRRSIEIFLREAGYEPIMASNGEEALEIFASRKVDLIITDIRMPGMDGIKLLQTIHEYNNSVGKAPVPEIVLTAYNDPNVKEAALRMGIRKFVLKPFKFDSFLQILENSFKN